MPICLQFVARESTDNETATIDDDEAAESEDESNPEDEEEESGDGDGQNITASKKMETSKDRIWNLRRQFNSAMGISIDAPMAQPQTNAYDIHNSHQGPAPWEASNIDGNAYVC